MQNKKMKAVTFSYDDGVTQDRRLIEIFDRYGLKATFNINSGLFGREGTLLREGATVNYARFHAEEIAEVYKNHEVAAHTLTHPALRELSDEEVIKQVEEDRLALSSLVGYEVLGMAYPGGGVNNDERVADLIKENTGIRYARTISSTHSFDVQDGLYRFNPTIHQHGEFDRTFQLAKEFIELKPETPKVFYIWGHSYELDIRDEWDKFEELCKLLSGHDDIFYGTNKEILL